MACWDCDRVIYTLFHTHAAKASPQYDYFDLNRFQCFWNLGFILPKKSHWVELQVCQTGNLSSSIAAVFTGAVFTGAVSDESSKTCPDSNADGPGVWVCPQSAVLGAHPSAAWTHSSLSSCSCAIEVTKEIIFSTHNFSEKNQSLLLT